MTSLLFNVLFISLRLKKMKTRTTIFLISLLVAATSFAQNISYFSGSSHRNTQRIPVLEHFTTEACGNCPPVMQTLIDHYNSEQNFYILSHHAGFYTDFLTTPKQEQMLDFYIEGSQFVPAGMVDRHYNGMDNDGDGFADLTPIFRDGEQYGINRIKGRLKYAPVTVAITGTFDLSTNKLDVEISGEFVSDFQRDLGLIVWVLEDNIPAQSQVGVPNYIHRFASRDALTDVFGDKITTPTQSGDTFTKSFSYEINPEWNKDELYILAMVGNMHPSDVNDREVHNSLRVKLVSMSSHIDGTETETDFSLSYNPASKEILLTNVDNAKIEIYNTSGLRVSEILSSDDVQIMDGNALQPGLHIVKVTKNNKTKTDKFIVVR